MDSLEPIKQKIYEIRGRRVMLDSDLADLYKVETKNLRRFTNYYGKVMHIFVAKQLFHDMKRRNPTYALYQSVMLFFCMSVFYR